MEERISSYYCSLSEISLEEFSSCADEEGFFKRYGNPVMIRDKNRHDLICMAKEYYDRMIQELETNRREKGIKYWIYEFNMPLDQKLEFDRVCDQLEMTPDEFIEAAVTSAVWRAEHDPEGFKRDLESGKEHLQHGMQIELVRYYPVFVGETEAQARRRIIAEEESERYKIECSSGLERE